MAIVPNGRFTSVAPTILRSGDKERSLPSAATMVVNFRIVPGETSAVVIDRDKKRIKDPSIQVELYGEPAIVHEPVPH